ncbi:uncharacterized protein SPSK_00786 [Sporothrix schenckii 1099-18]|uniref:D-xylose 1-dehydrogenase (NADP(+), D-xylono-1,5-lactone-forming) n=2 Tax=Sporothrix schenckii TaxID=29908 RepID=U7PM19_SPOS1|nr:uncharacterized protein SPSK_00786 [Sporothrix schenckii 1099-18]ERS95956.1 hypothetical protein HMPREF1624_07491 [Sporothrix schenckii ATCC 58251]KJR81798.1 hypothetical protein SPSK_00786 [Sporothrix schenckii 1099-18]
MEFVRRNWKIVYPPELPKTPDALRFGVLGAAKIVPIGLITPAKSHAEVIVQAVAARDKARATAFAKANGIPQVLDSYDAILNDPTIDAVYIPLPNGLHYEWTLKALAKGKHVLLEKPAVSNAGEAERLFTSPLLTTPVAAEVNASARGRPPVLLEAFHYRFQPAWQAFLSLVDRPNLATVHCEAIINSFLFSKDDIRFRYELAGGQMMDLGTYGFSTLRQVFAAEPEACLDCKVTKCDPPFELCDYASEATFQFPGGRTGTVKSTLRGGHFVLGAPWIRVVHKPVPAPLAAGETASAIPEGHERVVTRTLKLNNFLRTNLWHRLDVEDEFVVRRIDDPSVVAKRWTVKAAKKIYTFQDAGIDQPSEPFWLSFRHQLEQFVDRIRGREGSGVWVEHEDSIAQARMIDMAYKKTDLPLRPSSKYQPE